MDFSIKTTGDKIKNYRKYLHITQKELAGDALTRSFISQLEQKRKPLKLTEDKAEIIVKNLNSLSKKYNIAIDISVEYLMESVEDQQIKILNSISKELSVYKISKFDINDFQEFIDQVEEFLENNSEFFEKNILKNYIFKINIYREVAAIFTENHVYDLCQIYLLKATAYAAASANYNQMLDIILERIRVYYLIKNFEQGIILTEYAENYFERKNVSSELFKQLYCNKVAFLNKLNRPGISLKCAINLIEGGKYLLSEIEILKLKIIISNNYCLLKQFEKAEKNSLEVLNIALEKQYIDIVAQIYRNLAEMYIDMGQYANSKKYLENSISLRYTKNYTSMKDIYLNLIELSLNINENNSKIDVIFENLIKQCDIERDSKTKLKAYDLIFQYHMQRNNDTEILDLAVKIREEVFYKNFEVDEKILSILIKILNYLKNRNKKSFEEVFTISTVINTYLYK